MSKIKVLYFPDKKDQATKLYRILIPATALSANGLIEYDYSADAIFKSINGEMKFLDPKSITCEVAVFNQIINPRVLMLAKALKSVGKKIIYDSDDLYFDLPKHATVKLAKEDVEACRELYRIADQITVVSPHLGKMIEKHTGVSPDKINYIPNLIPFDEFDRTYHLVKKRKRDKLALGFMGMPNHVNDLWSLMPAIEQIKKKYGDKLELEIMGFNRDILDKIQNPATNHPIETIMIATDLFNKMEDLGFVFHPLVPLDKYFSYLASLNWTCAFSTLTNDRTDKSKSFLKFMDYSMARIPAVYRGISPMTDAVVDNHNGLLANSKNEYYDAIARLLDDAELRERLIKNALEDIEKKFSIEKNYHLWYEVIVKASKRS